MSFTFLYLIAAFATIFITGFLKYFKRLKDRKHLPPGPPDIPLLGNLHMVKSEFYLFLQEMWKQYGDIFRVYFGRHLTIVVSDVATIKYLLADERTSNRPDLFLFKVTDKEKGLGLANGHRWQQQRRFALSTLRDLGMGKTWLQDLILEEVAVTLNEFRRSKAQPVAPKAFLSQSIANIICGVTFGHRFQHNDPQFVHLLKLFTQNNLLIGQNRALHVFPELRLIPFSSFRKDYLDLVKNTDELMDYIQVLIDQHRKALLKQDENPIVKDYVFAFMEMQEKEQDNPNSTFDDEQLTVSVRTLFGAGNDTTAGTICFLMLHMLENADVMRKVQEEIDSVVGGSQFVTLEHKASLPFTEATIMEAQRMSPAIPATGRGLTDDIVLPNGYILPKGCHLAVNMFAVHHDPRYFPEPEVFKPSRFINEQGRLIKPDSFMPFASGKRMCLGESFARMQIFLYFANIIRTFDLHYPAGRKPSSKDVVFAQVNVPIDFDIVLKERV